MRSEKGGLPIVNSKCSLRSARAKSWLRIVARGFEHAAAAKPEPLHTGPDHADDIFRRVMGVLGAARERSISRCVDQTFELSADCLPTLAECFLTGATEDTVGEF